MSRIQVRFNLSRGQPGRGSSDHVWRLFCDGKEYVVKNVNLNVPSWGERDGQDWNIACEGILTLDRETSTATIDG